MMHATSEQKCDDEDGFDKAFSREPGAVEARQTAVKDLIPSELKASKRLQVRLFVIAA